MADTGERAPMTGLPGSDAVTVRLRYLLEALGTGRTLTGAELATYVGVDPRTLRRYILRLRSLGYPVRAAQGRDGYTLAPPNAAGTNR